MRNTAAWLSATPSTTPAPAPATAALARLGLFARPRPVLLALRPSPEVFLRTLSFIGGTFVAHAATLTTAAGRRGLAPVRAYRGW
jgi:hypothetical protein